MALKTAQRIPIPFAIPKDLSPAITLVQQDQTNWCWAACTMMVANFYGVAGYTQCKLANMFFGQSTCCQSGDSDVCNLGLEINQIAAVYSNMAIVCNYINGPVTLDVLNTQVNLQGNPVEISVAWSGSGSHVVIISGVDANSQVITVNDPGTSSSGGILYNDLLTYSGRGNWVASWINFVNRN